MKMTSFWCPNCGEGMAADEDGCCASCGADCIAETVFDAICAAERKRCVEAIREASKRWGRRERIVVVACINAIESEVGS